MREPERAQLQSHQPVVAWFQLQAESPGLLRQSVRPRPASHDADLVEVDRRFPSKVVRRSAVPHPVWRSPRPRAPAKGSHEEVSGTRTQRTEPRRARPGFGYRQDATGYDTSISSRG